MRRSLSVFVLAVAFLVGACGGGGGSGSSSAYCKELKDAASDALSSTSTSAPNMAALQVAFDKALDRISKHAPSEISDDYDVLKEYIDLRFQAAVDPAKATANKAKLEDLGTKYQAAQKNITDYNTKVCKLSAPTTAPSSATTATTAASTTTKK
ncbi:MAG TPA: hypothetical protein VFB78_04085 [Acidimicrobiales bacterium]|nr:hypothetical protein [Acidimicrobiales bacterium]